MRGAGEHPAEPRKEMRKVITAAFVSRGGVLRRLVAAKRTHSRLGGCSAAYVPGGRRCGKKCAAAPKRLGKNFLIAISKQSFRKSSLAKTIDEQVHEHQVCDRRPRAQNGKRQARLQFEQARHSFPCFAESTELCKADGMKRSAGPNVGRSRKARLVQSSASP